MTYVFKSRTHPRSVVFHTSLNKDRGGGASRGSVEERGAHSGCPRQAYEASHEIEKLRSEVEQAHRDLEHERDTLEAFKTSLRENNDEKSPAAAAVSPVLFRCRSLALLGPS